MRAPENSSRGGGVRPPTQRAEGCSGGSSLVYKDTRTQIVQHILSDVTSAAVALLSLKVLCVVESDATASLCHILIFI